MACVQTLDAAMMRRAAHCEPESQIFGEQPPTIVRRGRLRRRREHDGGPLPEDEEGLP
jgi:hypothetical protein